MSRDTDRASPTPRTDAIVAPRLDFTNDDSVRAHYTAMTEHARQLERELAELRADAERWIPVSERPAPTKGLIDVWLADGYRLTGCHWDHVCREHRCIQAGHLIRIKAFTHWILAPKPPAIDAARLSTDKAIP